MSISFQTLPIADWLAQFAEPTNAIEMPTCGYSRVFSKWRFDHRVLDEHLLYMITEHHCLGEVDGRLIELNPGSILWLQPGVEHSFWIVPGEPCLDLFHIRFRLIGDGVDYVHDERVIQVMDAWETASALERVVDEEQAELPFRWQCIRSYLLVTCAWMVRHTTEPGPEGTTFSLGQRQRLMELLRTQHHERLQPSDLAAELRLSTDYFTRKFRRTYGVSPRRFLVEERIRAAAQRLVESSQSIGEVADEFGYSDLHFFSRQFKQVMGVNPSTYRRRGVPASPRQRTQ